MKPLARINTWESRVAKRCHGGANLSYETVGQVGGSHCIGFFLWVNEKPETSGFSLAKPAQRAVPPRGKFFG
jgi:hypothetical protein